jgi:hypothetical protein
MSHWSRYSAMALIDNAPLISESLLMLLRASHKLSSCSQFFF